MREGIGRSGGHSGQFRALRQEGRAIPPNLEPGARWAYIWPPITWGCHLGYIWPLRGGATCKRWEPLEHIEMLKICSKYS